MLLKGVGGSFVMPKVAEVSEMASGFSVVGSPTGVLTPTFATNSIGYPASLTTPVYSVENKGAPVPLTTPVYTSTSPGGPTPLTTPAFVVSGELEVSS